MADFDHMLLEVYDLFPIDIDKYVSLNIEPSVLWKFKEAEKLVDRRRSYRPTTSKNVSNSEASDIVDFDYARLCICSVLDVTWEALNTGHWSKVPLSLRQLYTAASFIKILAILQSKTSVQSAAPINEANSIDKIESQNSGRISEALKTADMGLLLGAPLPSPHGALLQKVAKLLSSALAVGSEQGTSSIAPGTDHSAQSRKEVNIISGVKGQDILRLQRPSLEKFRLEHFDPQIPAILTDCIGHWPAMTRWSDISYLRRVAGARLVPVELGSRYTDEEWSQKLMTLTEFIDTYIDKKKVCEGDGVAYLAQHPLFDQVPELLSDIREPEYCCISNSESSEEEDTDINAWFGPEGTVSPLHYDPKHNLLAQVVGSKRVLLYSPKDSALLYPHEDRLLVNTARVDPECPDYVGFPSFQRACTWECRLESGEMLYIPPKWWHHIRSLEMSFSVSFWWQ